MGSRVAVLDLGTNTFHLLIADVGEGKPGIVYAETIAVKLGEGGISKGRISGQAFKRGIAALVQFKEKILKFRPDVVKSAATSAIRTASNGADFLKKVKAATGIELEMITGEAEAELIYQGVKAAVGLDQKSLVVDIGGGSVEFIICDQDEIFWKKSYPIGAARLMEKFHHSDPISPSEVGQINDFLGDTLTELKEQIKIHRPDLMIGASGAFETFAVLQDPQFKTLFSQPEFRFDLRIFSDVSEVIIGSTHAQRAAMDQIIPVRVDMIVVSALIMRYLLDHTKISTFKLSTYSLKEGILFGSLK